MRLAIAVLALALLGGCSSGDPGGKRLDELSADAVFAANPPGAASVEKAETPARNGVDGPVGPRVVASFTSSAPPETVIRFYGHRASAAGWNPHSFGALGLADTWTKRYPDGATALLELTQTGHSDEYRLSGLVAAAEEG